VAELRRALLDRGHGEDEVEAALDRLRRERYVDDTGYAERFARSRMANQGHGRLRVRQDLRLRGVDRRTVETGIAGALREVDEKEIVDTLARRYWRQHAAVEPARRLPRLWRSSCAGASPPASSGEAVRALATVERRARGLEPADDPGRPW